MKGIEAQRAAIRYLVLKELGIDPAQPRVFAGQANSLGMEAQMMRLPATLEPQVDLQDLTTGERYFMIDGSEIDGDHLIM